MRTRALMRYYQSFPTAIPLTEPGSPRVTHPSATNISFHRSFFLCPFDLHVLGTPPAFILSQDRTLMLNFSLSSDRVLIFLRLPGSFLRTSSLGAFALLSPFPLQRSLTNSFKPVSQTKRCVSRKLTVLLGLSAAALVLPLPFLSASIAADLCVFGSFLPFSLLLRRFRAVHGGIEHSSHRMF